VFDAARELNLFGGMTHTIKAAEDDLQGGEENLSIVLDSLTTVLARRLNLHRALISGVYDLNAVNVRALEISKYRRRDTATFGNCMNLSS
jgi:hypothetical protein